MTLVLFISFGSVLTASGADQWTAPHRKSVRVTQSKETGWQSTRGSANRSPASARFPRSAPRRMTAGRPTISSYRPVIHTEQIDDEGLGPDLLPSPLDDAQLPSPREDDRTTPSVNRTAPSLPMLLPSPRDAHSNRNFDRNSEADALREEYQDECQQSLAALRGRKLSDISLDITVDGTPGTDYPRACATGVKRVQLAELKLGERDRIDVAWTASGLCHKPLYFEETNLERYGHTAGPLAQPVLSAAHFFATLPVLPYKMGLKPPGECVYALGHYRPGDCAPYYIPAVPLSLRAGLVQAGAMVGAAAILP